jgi:hypothetical protein
MSGRALVRSNPVVCDHLSAAGRRMCCIFRASRTTHRRKRSTIAHDVMGVRTVAAKRHCAKGRASVPALAKRENCAMQSSASDRWSAT